MEQCVISVIIPVYKAEKVPFPLYRKSACPVFYGF